MAGKRDVDCQGSQAATDHQHDHQPEKTLASGDACADSKLSAERLKEPEQGKPEKKPAATLARPWPTNSWLLSSR